MNEAVGLVYKNGALAAQLVRAGKFTTFSYLPEYLESSSRPVASSLPLDIGEISLPNGATPSYFAGLLPEGRRLSAIANRLGTTLDDDLAILLEIGADLIGDVQVLLPGAKPETERESLKIPIQTESLDFAALRDSYFGLKSTGLPGVQDKVSSKMLNARARMANIDYILKFNPAEAPHAVENEAFFLQLAKRCGIKTADFKLLSDGKGEVALRLQRFDRIALRYGKQRLAVEDGCQVLDLYPVSKYQVDFLEVAKKLIARCPSQVLAAKNLFSQLVFNWLIGNGDAHAKNISIIEPREADWEVSPAYDLICTRFYDDRDMALALAGKRSGWTRQLLHSAALELGLSLLVAEKVINHQLLVLRDLPEQILAGALPFPKHKLIDVSSFLKKRSRAIS